VSLEDSIMPRQDPDDKQQNKQAWAPKTKASLLEDVDKEISQNDSWANGNDNWIKFFVVAGILLNVVAAGAAASVNGEAAVPFIQTYKAWLLWGAALAALLAGAATAIPAATDMNKRRAAYTQAVYALKVLRVEIQIETVSPQQAAARYKEILGKHPFRDGAVP
jgi:hypothetical protein